MSGFYYLDELEPVKATPRWSDLMYLRSQREAAAQTIRYTANNSQHVEDMITGRYASSAYYKLRADFYDHHFHASLDRLDVFKALCDRIAELEEAAISGRRRSNALPTERKL